ncbi:MAG: aminotransferase class III-fold pyridoxal phosphate-dependent enzyme [Planctomycetota bacterium]
MILAKTLASAPAGSIVPVRTAYTAHGETPRADSLSEALAALEKDFARRCPKSVELYRRAAAAFPGGVTHDSRRVAGPSLFVSQAGGARKLDPDWNLYVDYWVGHGSLLLGHGRQEVVQAIQLAAQDATHPGACHEREVLWAEQVLKLVPGAERVRFTASGSESTALAVRLARGLTGKPCILKFEGHFHGWLDHAVQGVDVPFDVPFSTGVPEAVRGLTCVLPARDLNIVAETLARRNDIAAIILEPTGAAGGSVPIRSEFLHGLRELASRHGVVLIFDEVITGFRLAPGGAQERFNVRADLTCLAKILAGGMPGGAVCGTRAAFAAMEFTADAKRNRAHRVAQYGTFNANPVCAAAGTAMLRLVSDGKPQRQAEAYADKLRAGLNALFRQERLSWAAYGFSSVFHILTSDAPAGAGLRDGQLEAADVAPVLLKQKGPLDGLLRRALQLEGVDLPPGRQAWISAAHGEAELRDTLASFSRAIARLRALGVLEPRMNADERG